MPDDAGPVYPAFVHFVIPYKHDLAIQGPSDFENFSLGAQLYAKLFATPLLGTGFLLSAGYTYERFYNLDKDVHLYHISASMGFTPR